MLDNLHERNNSRHTEKGLPESPLYNGQIKSIGPRYCPSIETKIVTFADKSQHQLFLEPESENGQEYYLNGFSSSLPMEIQYEALHTIPGLEHAKIYRPGYAIEYDFFDPTQLYHSLETKRIKNLFLPDKSTEQPDTKKQVDKVLSQESMHIWHALEKNDLLFIATTPILAFLSMI